MEKYYNFQEQQQKQNKIKFKVRSSEIEYVRNIYIYFIERTEIAFLFTRNMEHILEHGKKVFMAILLVVRITHVIKNHLTNRKRWNLQTSNLPDLSDVLFPWPFPFPLLVSTCDKFSWIHKEWQHLTSFLFAAQCYSYAASRFMNLSQPFHWSFIPFSMHPYAVYLFMFSCHAVLWMYKNFFILFSCRKSHTIEL